ncbi:helix-turn-helix domain-containing protein [Paenibacillus polymyxa]|uniref:helix-turn-helix domain-containing protein n=1 Tax=Paenibacillus polymyxa TaxID=1406 RepID=UPI000401C14C|nr:helix-turn-helix transcriptional regulator [Paenibacillus polymyxa]
MVKLKLDKAVNMLGLSMNRLSIASGVRPHTVGDLVRNDSQRVDLDSLDKILNALNSIAEDRGLDIKFGVADIIEYEYLRKEPN